MQEELWLVGLAIAFGLGCLVVFPKRGPLDHLNALKKINESKNKILVRHNGVVAGLVLDEDDSYDPDSGVNRKTMIVLGMNGKRHEEPKDYIDEITGQLESAVPSGLEHRHGIVLTQLGNPDGSVHPILAGAEAMEIRRDSSQFNVLKQDMRKQKKKFGPVLDGYRDLQGQLDDKDKELKAEREELSDRRSATRSLANQNEALAARATGAEAERDMLVEQLEHLKQQHNDLVEDTKKMWAGRRDIERLKVKAGALGEEDRPPKPAEKEKPPAPEEPPAEKKSEEKGK